MTSRTKKLSSLKAAKRKIEQRAKARMKRAAKKKRH